MATQAQRAARKRRRQRRALKRRSGGQSVVRSDRKRKNIVLEQMVSLPQRKRRVKRARGGAGLSTGPVAGMNYMATDGINSSRVVTNHSTVEDTFQVRREKIGNVSGTSAFTLAQSLYVNPGNTVLFPIFSQIAATYEEYRVNKLLFTFETDAYTATNGTASAGKVILATNFDPDDSTFSGDTQMENYVGSVKGPPYAPIISHDIMMAGRSRKRGARGDFSLNNYFVYSSANSLAPGTGQGKFYDVGLFQLATSGNAVTSEIGELYVTYSFTMIRPKQQTPLGQNIIAAQYSNTTATATAAAPMTPSGAAMVQRAGSTMNLTFTATTCVLPPTFNGRLIGQCTWVGTGIAAVPAVAASAGATAVNYLFVNTLPYDGQFLSGGTTATLVFMVDSVNGGTLTFSGLTSMAAATVDLCLVQLPSGLTLKLSDAEKALDKLERINDVRIDALTRQMDELKAMISHCSSPVCVVEDDKLSNSIHIPRALLSQYKDTPWSIGSSSTKC